MKMFRMRGASLAVLACAMVGAFSLSACATTDSSTPSSDTAETKAPKPLATGLDYAANSDPYPSTYQPLPRQNSAIVGATVFTGAGQRIENGVVLMADGKVQAVGGADLAVPAGYTVIDGKGRFVTPGVIDVHSHLGVYPSPGVQGMSDGNEATSPNTAQVWAEHSVWPQDPGFNTARAGGVTTLGILPGSANLFGGRGVTLRNVPALSV
ncbi:MAG TPA: amidohydrolase, partial [Brevundimonas sp.]